MAKFIDLVNIEVFSGRGGDGKVAWRREKYVPNGGPAGGDGGHGGSVWLEASTGLNTLLDFHFRHEFKAQDGEGGGSSRKSGRTAEDLIIKVPVGTVVSTLGGQEQIIADLSHVGQKLLVAKGGRGGRGNQHFATSTRQAPHFCEPGEPGQHLKLKLELKLVAGVGIIGLPNAGKSTLISRLSAAKPKIADYPFTTLVPNLGMLQLAPEKSVTIADIPGLIEGASQGIGLGFQFLRHVQRTKVLVHLLDASLEDISQIKKNYQIVLNELKSYDPEILEKKQILVINKIDACTPQKLDEIKELFAGQELLFISAVSGAGLQELKNKFLQTPELFEETHFEKIIENQESLEKIKYAANFEVSFNEEKNVYQIAGPLVEGWVRVTDFKEIESVNHLFRQLKKVKLFEELEKYGIKTEDTVLVGNREMVWSDLAQEKLT
jgi:GTPase